MKIIEENPYRIIGVLSNASKKEIVANQGKIKAFIKTKRTISFDNDFSNIFKPVIRTEESLANANSAITLLRDKYAAGLFWFMSITKFDEIALSHLKTGDIDNAITILRKKTTISACINLAILHIIKKDWLTAIYYYTYLLNSSERRNELIGLITNNVGDISEEEAVNLFVEKLLLNFPKVPWLDCMIRKEITIQGKNSNIGDFLLNSNVSKSLSNQCAKSSEKILEGLLYTANSVVRSDSEANIKAVQQLENDSKIPLRTLRISLGKEDKRYLQLCDKIANQILDNCINYYNNTHDSDKAKQIIKYLRYALRISTGAVVRERCQKNYDYIKEEYDSIYPEEQIISELETINSTIDSYNDIEKLDGLLGICSCMLVDIYTKLGENHKLYKKTSSKVVHFAITAIINDINEKLHAYNKASDNNNAKELMDLRLALKRDKSIYGFIKSFIKDEDSQERYEDNLKTIDSLYTKYHVAVLELTAKVPAIKKKTIRKQKNKKTENIMHNYLKIGDFRKISYDFIMNVRKLMSDPSQSSVNHLFSLLKPLKIDPGYTLDVFTYFSKYISPKDIKKSGYNTPEKYVYVRREEAYQIYKPVLVRNFWEKLFNLTPKKIEFKDTEFNDFMIIEDTLFTDKVLSCIPNTINHVQLDFDINGLWHLALYLCMINNYRGEIIFDTYELIDYVKENDYSGGYFIDKSQYDSFCSNPNSLPYIDIKDDNATISFCQLYSNCVMLRQYSFKKKDTHVIVLNRKSYRFVEFKKNESPRRLAGSIVTNRYY